MLIITLHLFLSYVYFWLSGYVLFSLMTPGKAIPSFHATLPLTGFLIHLPLLSLLSLFFPLDHTVFLGIAFLILASLFIKNKFFLSSGGILSGFHLPPFNIPALLLIVLTLLLASIPPDLPDMWGYHLQSVQWTEKYAAIPGLGNLCPKFAFNFGTFLPVSLLSFRNILGQPLITVNAFLLILLILHLTYLFQKAVSFAVVLLVLAGLFSVIHFFNPLISSTSADCSSAILVMVLFVIILTRKFDPSMKENDPISLLTLLLILILPVIKLSNTAFILLTIPFVWGVSSKSLRWLPVMAVLCYAPWMGRNIILSGYLWYPFPFLDFFHYDWKIPETIALQDYHWIRSWARMPFVNPDQVSGISWINHWVHQAGFFTWFFFITGCFSTSVLFIIHRFRKFITRDLLSFLIINMLVLIFWVFTAPDPRFIIASLVLFPLIPLIIIISGFQFRLSQKYMRLIIIFLCLSFVVYESAFINKLSEIPLIQPEKFPQKSMKQATIKWMTLHLPESGVNSFDFPVPCAPSVIRGFEPRGTSLEEGFRIVGSLQIPSIQPTTNDSD